MKRQIDSDNLRLVVFESARELGKKVDECLLKMYNLDKSKNTFIVPIKENFFEDGHLKVEIESTVRGKDNYFSFLMLIVYIVYLNKDKPIDKLCYNANMSTLEIVLTEE